MATLVVEDTTQLGDGENNIFKKIRSRINEKFDSIIQKVNERRNTLLIDIDLLEQGFEETRSQGASSLRELESERSEMEKLLSTLKIETARKSMMNGISELNKEIRKLNENIDFSEMTFVCETNDIEWRISQLGILSKEKLGQNFSKNYKEISEPLKVFRKDFKNPRGLLVDDFQKRIFVADMNNARVQVLTMDGDYISEFGKNTFVRPWEIVMSEDYLFISDFGGHCLTKWSSKSLNFVNVSSCPKGKFLGQLIEPSGLDIDGKEIFVVETGNYRISVFDLDLNFKRVLADKKFNQAFCLRIRNDTIYIVEATGVIKLFSKSNQLLGTLNKVSNNSTIYHFNFDYELNFLISDFTQNCLSILSQGGQAIHCIRFSPLNLNAPFGVAVTMEGHVVVNFQRCNSLAFF